MMYKSQFKKKLTLMTGFVVHGHKCELDVTIVAFASISFVTLEMEGQVQCIVENRISHCVLLLYCTFCSKSFGNSRQTDPHEI